MSETDKYGPMRDKLETQIIGSKTTVSRGMSPYDIFSISVRVPYMYSVDLEYDVMLDASSSPDVGFKPICADMGAEGARQTLWQWYNWCKIDELESLQVWDTSDDTSLFRLTLELLHKFKEYSVKILLQSWDGAKVAVNAVQSVLNFEGMGCFAKPRNETDLEEAIISIPITAVTREETFEEPEALFCVVGQDAQVAVVFPLHTMCGSEIKICIVKCQPPVLVKEFNTTAAAWEANHQSLLSYLAVLLGSITRPVVARRKLLCELQSRLHSVLEYDPRTFHSIHFLLRLRLQNPPTHVMCIVRVELSERYPQEGPCISLLEPLGACVETLSSSWFCSEWDADRAAEELIYHISRILSDQRRVAGLTM